MFKKAKAIYFVPTFKVVIMLALFPFLYEMTSAIIKLNMHGA